MNSLTLGILIAALIIISFLFILLRRGKESPASEEAVSAQTETARRPEPQLQRNAADPETRFIESPKRRQYRLLNDSEQELYHRLCEAVPNLRVFAQVGVAQLALARGRQEAQRLNRMAGRGVDFVICDSDFSIVAGIELAWPTTPQSTDNAEEVKRVALQSLGIPLIVFRPNKLPDADTISREIADAILRRKRLEAERD